MKRRPIEGEGFKVPGTDHVTRPSASSFHYVQVPGARWRIAHVNLAVGYPPGISTATRRNVLPICHRCNCPRPRKGGSNIGHRFVCARCQ